MTPVRHPGHLSYTNIIRKGGEIRTLIIGFGDQSAQPTLTDKVAIHLVSKAMAYSLYYSLSTDRV